MIDVEAALFGAPRNREYRTVSLAATDGRAPRALLTQAAELLTTRDTVGRVQPDGRGVIVMATTRRGPDRMMNITTAGLAHARGQLEPDCELAVERIRY